MKGKLTESGQLIIALVTSEEGNPKTYSTFYHLNVYSGPHSFLLLLFHFIFLILGVSSLEFFNITPGDYLWFCKYFWIFNLGIFNVYPIYDCTWVKPEQVPSVQRRFIHKVMATSKIDQEYPNFGHLGSTLQVPTGYLLL